MGGAFRIMRCLFYRCGNIFNGSGAEQIGSHSKREHLSIKAYVIHCPDNNQLAARFNNFGKLLKTGMQLMYIAVILDDDHVPGWLAMEVLYGCLQATAVMLDAATRKFRQVPQPKRSLRSIVRQTEGIDLETMKHFSLVSSIVT